MTIIDRVFLLLTGLIAAYMIYYFFKKNNEEKCSCNYYFILSFLVLLVAGLILIFSGWDALANNFVAVVAGLIPFGLATGLIAKHYKKNELWYAILMLIGLILITYTRYAGAEKLGKIVYPIFHAIAGLTIFFVPIILKMKEKVSSNYLFITVGGTLIGLGGIALAFLKAGKQLLFFSQDFVLMILAPLLFFTALFFMLGFTKE